MCLTDVPSTCPHLCILLGSLEFPYQELPCLAHLCTIQAVMSCLSLSTPTLSPCSSVRVALEGGGGVYLGCLGLVLRVCRRNLWDPVKFLSNPGKKDLETKEEMCADTTLLNHDTQNGNQAGLARCRTVVPVDTGQSGTEHGPHPSNYNLGF